VRVQASGQNAVASRISLTNNGVVMSVSTVSIENAWPKVDTLEGIFVGSSVRSGDIYDEGLSVEAKSCIYLQGRLDISSIGVGIPDHTLKMSSINDTLIFENVPTDSWPKYVIKLPEKSLEEGGSSSFRIEPVGKTVDGGLLFTRVVFSLLKRGEGIFHVYSIPEPLNFSVSSLPEPTVWRLLYRAKLYRKLKYLQDVFDVNFLLPDEISSDEVKRIETVFRGITEGAFSMREPQATFQISPADINLNAPPYFGPGQFDASFSEETITLLGQRLQVGPVIVHLDKAELGNPSAVDQIQKGSQEPVMVRFEILDNQISFRFEDYIQQAREHRLASLDRFKEELAREEPQELVDLIDELLQNDVSSDEASQIVMGWTQYHDLPDRYCPQEPELDVATRQWRVPIWLVYANGEGGPVGEVVIDVQTGVIVSHTPIEELRRKGLTLAKQILHAG
jgi:hypothetical protein